MFSHTLRPIIFFRSLHLHNQTFPTNGCFSLPDRVYIRCTANIGTLANITETSALIETAARILEALPDVEVRSVTPEPTLQSGRGRTSRSWQRFRGVRCVCWAK